MSKTSKSEKQSAKNTKKTCVLLGPWGANDAEYRYREDLDTVLKRVFSQLTQYEYKPYWAHPTTDMRKTGKHIPIVAFTASAMGEDAPFRNGNGRTVRLLTYAMLVKLGFHVNQGGEYSTQPRFSVTIEMSITQI